MKVAEDVSLGGIIDADCVIVDEATAKMEEELKGVGENHDDLDL